ncbi:hypothetical protein [Streptomyces sp. WMMC940]|uniref:hypothetical protein n=1 Tax=Streptomyces sp. WMMC940 TaxID=3015153 RepID=UPI003FCE879B
MAANSRLTIATHALAWLALAHRRGREVLTSEQVAALEVYDAVDAHRPFGLHHTEPNPECPVGRGIRPALSGVYDRVELVMRRELADTSIADVLRETLVNQPTVRRSGGRKGAVPPVVTRFVPTAERG